MLIKLMHSGQDPIYVQIVKQIKAQILNGTLKPNDSLPSMRALASDLKISVITTKRAYEELENEGFIYTVVGKGCFVCDELSAVIDDEYKNKINKALDELIEYAKTMKLSKEELLLLVKEKWSE